VSAVAQATLAAASTVAAPVLHAAIAAAPPTIQALGVVSAALTEFFGGGPEDPLADALVEAEISGTEAAAAAISDAGEGAAATSDAGAAATARTAAGVAATATTDAGAASSATEDAGDTVSLFKAPQPGRGASQFDNGYSAADFPGGAGQDVDGLAYFARDKSIADEFADSYGEGVIETKVPRSVYESQYAQYEYPYQGGPRTEVPIPASAVEGLNPFERIWHP
jgi:hypothetical protein